MAECIDRQVAVDALARLCKRVCQYSEKQRQYMCGACPLGDAFTVIEDDLPAADVRPVVLCRDCKFTKTDETEDPAIYCEKWDRWEMPPDGFCWLGKKRKETTNGN